MRPILRKLRGALGTAVTWAVVWALGGFAFATLLYVRVDGVGYGPFLDFAGGAALTLGLWGLASGALFSGALATIHRRRSLGELKTARVGLLGGFAGFLGTFVIGITLGVSSLGEVGLMATAALVWGAVGMATAVGTVWLAQRGATEIESSGPRPAIEAPRI